VGLIARGLELNGIATTLTGWHAGFVRRPNPPRAIITQLAQGATLGQPHNAVQQRRVLDATLALLAQDAPLDIQTMAEFSV